jgi:AraC family transcriptional regulator, regulatory protein of adaptative response / methylated-DNA-[protein]-cysteine methyltransferase
MAAMNTRSLPRREIMIRAFQTRDASFEGIFFTGVRSTGIFCRVGCPARTPRENQLEFFATTRDALFAGFRPCKRCRPIEPAGSAPPWLQTLLKAVDSDPENRWTDSDISALRLHPDRVRRWFQKNHGMTFHAYARARRLGLALAQIREGGSVVSAAFDHGYDSLSGFNDAFRQVLGTNPKTAKGSNIVHVARMPTPLGPMIAVATHDAVCLLEFADRRMLELQFRRVRKYFDAFFIPAMNPILETLAHQLEEYFAGELRRFTVPLDIPGTDFQRSVWTKLQQIPYGTTTSYRDIAVTLNVPSAVRAVARANGDNRIAIIIPCHRVIGSNGDLTGYGGGLWRKRRLLEIEGCRVEQPAFEPAR